VIQSKIHKLRAAFLHIVDTETIDPAFSDRTWTQPVKIDIANSREESIDKIANGYTNHTCVYSDGSGYKDMVGAAVTATDENGHTFSRLKHLGPLGSHRFYEAEVIGIPLAVDIIKEMQAKGKIAILLDNQSEIASMSKRKQHSGQHLAETAQSLLYNLVRTHPDIELTIFWVPGHKGTKPQMLPPKKWQRAYSPTPFYLHRIKAIDSPLCLRCGVPDTVRHYLTMCPRHNDARTTLHKAIKRRPCPSRRY
jgi:hypothetical protein